MQKGIGGKGTQMSNCSVGENAETAHVTQR